MFKKFFKQWLFVCLFILLLAPVANAGSDLEGKMNQELLNVMSKQAKQSSVTVEQSSFETELSLLQKSLTGDGQRTAMERSTDISESEPNDSIRQANCITLDTIVNAQLKNYNDTDYFKIYLKTGGELSIVGISQGDNEQLRIVLKDSNGNYLETGDYVQTSDTDGQILTRKLKAGTYYIFFYSWNTSTVNENYFFRARLNSASVGPEISNVVPARESTNVALNQFHSIVFDSPITVKSETGISIFKRSPLTEINSYLDYPSNNSLTISPANLLEANSEYFIIIADGAIEDRSGNPIENYIWGFETGNTVLTAAVPTANLACGAVDVGTLISLSTTTAGASIYYTTDGTVPSRSSTLYSSPIEISADTTIKAITIKCGMADSGIMIANYTVITCLPDYGELTGDGLIDVGDAITLLKHIAGVETLSACQLQLADLDGTTGVDIGDAIVLLRYIAGIIPSLPAQVP